ncbi:MerR family transcriptional regulator [Streptomyces sp. NPDC003077]|uniref:MerR family transcriptional regulator n=1 Tax=Streptomyces sp. NPDC003077 TaxID=3154443 RepID=UPI0033ABC9B9
MRIGEFARRAGISERALRYYEEQGLLRPRRRPSGYREYEETDMVAVRRIRTLLAAGLGTGTIAEILPCMLDVEASEVPSCPELAEVLVEERERINESIDELMAARSVLDAIISASLEPVTERQHADPPDAAPSDGAVAGAPAPSDAVSVGAPASSR